jgi:hypothetical protein
MQKPSYLELPLRLLWARCITYGVSCGQQLATEESAARGYMGIHPCRPQILTKQYKAINTVLKESEATTIRAKETKTDQEN